MDFPRKPRIFGNGRFRAFLLVKNSGNWKRKTILRSVNSKAQKESTPSRKDRSITNIVKRKSIFEENTQRISILLGSMNTKKKKLVTY